jgi:hypothetical protein
MARTKNYTLGAGKLFFNRLDENGVPTGEFYIGNTTSLTGATDETREEHFSSDERAREKDASVVTQSDETIGFTTDDIQPENLAMLWKGTAEILSVAAITDEAETFVVRRGRWYQIGESPTAPTGARSITVASVTDNADPTPAAVPGGAGGANYDLDLELGRIFIKEDAPDIADGDSIIVTYSAAAHSREVILSKGEVIRGSLRYIADNTAGVNRDDFWPLVDLSPDGDYEFKADSWSEMSFSGEVLKKEGYESKHYIDGRPVVA